MSIIVLERDVYNKLRGGKTGEIFNTVFKDVRLADFGVPFSQRTKLKLAKPANEDEKKLRFTYWKDSRLDYIFGDADDEDGRDRRKGVSNFFAAIKYLSALSNSELAVSRREIKDLPEDAAWLDGFLTAGAVYNNEEIDFRSKRLALPEGGRGFKKVIDKLALDAGVLGKAFVMEDKEFDRAFEVIESE